MEIQSKKTCLELEQEMAKLKYILEQAGTGYCARWYWGTRDDGSTCYVRATADAMTFDTWESANAYLINHYLQYNATNGFFIIRSI
jgi:hypothetical protein